MEDCREEYVVLANTRALFNQISGMKCKGDTCGGSYRGRSIKAKGLGGTAVLIFECDRCHRVETISTGTWEETRFPPYTAPISWFLV